MTEQERGLMEMQWRGPIPDTCEVCDEGIKDVFVDGIFKRRFAQGWACMCLACHADFGTGLGMGRGQKYERREGIFVLTEGADHASERP